MPPSTIPIIRECHADLIIDFNDRLYETAVPESTHISGKKGEVPLRRRFSPVPAVRRIFSIDEVREILNHDCENCRTHLAGNPQAQPTRDSPEKILRTDAVLSLFALLVSLRYPLLIGTFLASYDLDSLPLPRYFSLYDLRDRQFQHLPYRPKEQLVAAFQEQKWQFSVPTFGDGSFQSYEEGTILPFLDEKPVGTGGYGKVFKVWIHPYYCNLGPVKVAGASQPNAGAKIFARKEIIGEDAIEFVKERTNLERIATLKDPHLVQIQKTYQLGDKFNILFPCAKTNLFDYLRNNKWRAPIHAHISKNPLWEQVLGITQALSKIINFTDPENPGHVLFGYHLDLKPQNILVDNAAAGSGDIFKITDFGQTRFIEPAFAGTSRIIGGGGTDAYAPPEYLEAEQDRAYDVWSLAIILLEILAYAIKGIDGLLNLEKGLDTVRLTNEDGNQNARFYTGRRSTARVKPAIITWMKTFLIPDPSISNPESQEFVRKLLDLIMEMLEPQMKSRLPIDDVLSRMGDIFKMKASETVEITTESLREKDEIVIVDLKQVEYYPRGLQGRQSTRLSFIMFENRNHTLRTYLGNPILPARDQRQEMQLIVAFQHTADVEDAFELSFSSIRREYAVSLQDGAIIVSDKTIASRLQMALTGHNVSDRYQVASMTISPYHLPLEELGSKIKTWISWPFRKSKENENKHSNTGPVPLWIEIWLEKPQVALEMIPPPSLAAEQVSARRRANRQVNPDNKVPRGRVVIYCEDRIVILPFVKEGHLAMEKDMKRLRSRNIVFEPMDTRQRDFFSVSQILRSTGHLPGIPMDHAALYEAESKSEFKCESIKLKFENPDDAYAFCKLYKNEKARWLDLIKGKTLANASLMPLS